jgi:hypothetical protein
MAIFADFSWRPFLARLPISTAACHSAAAYGGAASGSCPDALAFQPPIVTPLPQRFGQGPRETASRWLWRSSTLASGSSRGRRQRRISDTMSAVGQARVM